ncbi:MAG TPA: hydrogenase maturation nickel metallochaperone HypA [Vicinamibacterales bacterium]|jgi:hydrogenase nickel incorporation protein HypA/HybF|nr:hydrogenase maturation nickel metallochaperone HypA [Vicinamibacterales bacterium]
MHEYSIVQALYDTVVAQAAANRAVSVHGLRVRIGELSGVDPGLLDTAWRTFRERTLCAAAPLEVEMVSARWRCSQCGGEIARGGILTCGSCGGAARLEQGDEILLDRIVMEVP